MAGQASGGQQLTPNKNVTAPAGVGGDLWGANGGGITPVGGAVPAISTVKQTLSNGQREANAPYLLNSYGVATPLLAAVSTGAVQVNTADNVMADDSTATAWPADQESPFSADSQL